MGKALAAQPIQRGATGAMSRFPRYNASRSRRNSGAGKWARAPTGSPAATCIRSGMPSRPRPIGEGSGFPAGFRGCQVIIPTRRALRTCRPTPTLPDSCHATSPALSRRNRPARPADIRRKPRGIIHCSVRKVTMSSHTDKIRLALEENRPMMDMVKRPFEWNMYIAIQELLRELEEEKGRRETLEMRVDCLEKQQRFPL